MKFKRQVELEIKGKHYVVSLHELNENNPYYCAYVILKGKHVFNYMDLECCTYNEEDVYGVDTNHLHNLEQTSEEKYYDAIRQIKLLIEDYDKYDDYLTPLLDELYIAGENRDEEEAKKLIQNIIRLIKERE